MRKPPTECLREGAAILGSILHRHGFEFQWGGSGPSSGGLFAFGFFVFGDRKLELHYRHSLGLVTYHFDRLSLAHDSYMRAVLGPNRGSHYPGFSEEPLAPFEDLKFDLEHHATAFLLGDKQEFSRCVNASKEWESNKGFSRLA